MHCAAAYPCAKAPTNELNPNRWVWSSLSFQVSWRTTDEENQLDENEENMEKERTTRKARLTIDINNRISCCSLSRLNAQAMSTQTWTTKRTRTACNSQKLRWNTWPSRNNVGIDRVNALLELRFIHLQTQKPETTDHKKSKKKTKRKKIRSHAAELEMFHHLNKRTPLELKDHQKRVMEELQYIQDEDIPVTKLAPTGFNTTQSCWDSGKTQPMQQFPIGSDNVEKSKTKNKRRNDLKEKTRERKRDRRLQERKEKKKSFCFSTMSTTSIRSDRHNDQSEQRKHRKAETEIGESERDARCKKQEKKKKERLEEFSQTIEIRGESGCHYRKE